MKDFRKERCKELYERWVKGEYLVDLVSELSEKYDVKENTIYKDWNTRHDWLDKVFSTPPEKEKDAISEIMTKRKIIEFELWKLYKNTDSENVKLGALKRLDKRTSTLFDDLCESGIIERASDKYEIKHEEGDELSEKTDELIEIIKDEKEKETEKE